MRTERAWKRPGDEFILGVDFTTWPVQTGESLVNSNARGSLSVTVTDAQGGDVTSQIVEAPAIITGTLQVAFLVKGGTAGAVYYITVVAPTSDDELLTEYRSLEVRESFET